MASAHDHRSCFAFTFSHDASFNIATVIKVTQAMLKDGCGSCDISGLMIERCIHLLAGASKLIAYPTPWSKVRERHHQTDYEVSGSIVTIMHTSRSKTDYTLKLTKRELPVLHSLKHIA